MALPTALSPLKTLSCRAPLSVQRYPAVYSNGFAGPRPIFWIVASPGGRFGESRVLDARVPAGFISRAAFLRQ